MLAQPLMHCPPPAAQRHYIEEHIQSGRPFDELVLQDANPKAVIEVSDGYDFIVNPLAIAYHGRIVDYAGRITDGHGSLHVEMIPAKHATVRAYIGNRALGGRRLKPEIVDRVLRAVPDQGGNRVVGFTDGHKGYGMIP